MNTQKEKLVYHADEVEKKREGLHAFARNHRLFARQQKTLLLRTHILYMYICMCHMLSTIRALTISMKNTFFHSVYLPPLPLSPSTSLSLSLSCSLRLWLFLFAFVLDLYVRASVWELDFFMEKSSHSKPIPMSYCLYYGLEKATKTKATKNLCSHSNGI